jgi:hypothetical protein
LKINEGTKGNDRKEEKLDPDNYRKLMKDWEEKYPDQ